MPEQPQKNVRNTDVFRPSGSRADMAKETLRKAGLRWNLQNWADLMFNKRPQQLDGEELCEVPEEFRNDPALPFSL